MNTINILNNRISRRAFSVAAASCASPNVKPPDPKPQPLSGPTTDASEPVEVATYEIVDYALEPDSLSGDMDNRLYMRGTNISDKQVRIDPHTQLQAHQCGTELSPGILVDMDHGENRSVQPGYSSENQLCYRLIDQESPVEIEFASTDMLNPFAIVRTQTIDIAQLSQIER